MLELRLNPHLLKVPLYIAGKSVEEVQEELGLDEVLKLGSNENPLGPSPLALAAAQEAMREGHRYPNHWEKVLRRKLAQSLGPGFTERNVLTGNGGCDVLRIIAQGFIQEGDEALTASATFPMYLILTTMFGGRTVTVPLTRDFHFDLPGILRAITPETRVVFLCSPNNPTGLIIRQAEADAFMAELPEHVVVVFDESYGGFCADGGHVDSPAYVLQGRNAVVMRSFSKSAGLANFRVGYAIARPELIEYLHHAQLPFNTGSVSLAAAAASLDDHAYQRRSLALADEERRYLYAALDDLDLRYLPSQGNFVLVLDPPVDARLLAERVLHAGVIIRWAGSMGVPNGVRITLGTREQNQRCIVALRAALEAGAAEG